MKNTLYTIALIALATSCTNSNNQWDATGTFEATEILVSAESNGRILSLNIDEGDKISAGTNIGAIDSMQIYLKTQQLTATLKATDIRKPDIHKQIGVLKQQLSTAQMELERAKRLFEANAGNKKHVDDLENQIKLLNSQISAQYSTLSKTYKSTDAEIESLQYQLIQAYDLLYKCQITNPRTGTILNKYAEMGEMATIGKPLYKIADLEIMDLRAYITTDQLSKVKLGDIVHVFSDQGNEYSGKITWISEKGEFTPKGILTKDERANQVFAIKVSVKNDGYLKIGQYGEIKLR
ncbi:MAG: efflux RND transporter periplasmic adaptor subunit [Bacteroidales bacterium]